MPNGDQHDRDQGDRNQGDRDQRYDWLYEPGARDGWSQQRPSSGEGGPPEDQRTRAVPVTRPSRAQGQDRAPGQRRTSGSGGGRGSGGPREPRPRRRHRWGRTIGLIVLAYLIFLLVIPLIAWARVDKVAFEPGDERPADTPGTTYLLVGSDSREGLTHAEEKRLGTGDTSGKRTDTIMLLHVPRFGGDPVLVSVPRDSYVPIPGHGSNKINAAFSLGGPKLLTHTLEDATGMRIDEYVEVGFGGFVGVVEGLGGVRMCLDQAIQDSYAHIDLPKGCQTLNGPNALGYVRARHFDPRSDLGRVERQRKFLGAVVHKAVSPSTIFNPIRYTRFGLAGGDALTAGKGTGPYDLARFAWAMRSISNGDGQTTTVPLSDTSYQTSVGSAVKWDSDKALELFHALEDNRRVPADLIPKN